MLSCTESTRYLPPSSHVVRSSPSDSHSSQNLHRSSQHGPASWHGFSLSPSIGHQASARGTGLENIGPREAGTDAIEDAMLMSPCRDCCSCRPRLHLVKQSSRWSTMGNVGGEDCPSQRVIMTCRSRALAVGGGNWVGIGRLTCPRMPDEHVVSGWLPQIEICPWDASEWASPP